MGMKTSNLGVEGSSVRASMKPSWGMHFTRMTRLGESGAKVKRVRSLSAFTRGNAGRRDRR